MDSFIIFLGAVVTVISLAGLYMVIRDNYRPSNDEEPGSNNESNAAFISQPAPVGYGKPSAPIFPQAASPFMPVEEADKKN